MIATSVQSYTGLGQKESMHKQSTVEYTNKHANKSQTNIHKRHLRTRKHYRWSPSISLQFSNKNKHLQ